MQRKFLTNLSLLLFLNILIKPFWILGIDRTVQNMVGSVEFGEYYALFNFSFLFNILLDFGITNFNNKNIAQNNHLLNKHLSSILALKSLLAIGYFVIIFFGAVLMGYDKGHYRFLVLLGLNQFLISLVLYLRSNISGLLLFKTDSMLSVLDRLLMILICSVLIWGNVMHTPFRLEWFVYAQTAAYLMTALIALVIVARKAAFKRLNWNWPFFVMIVKKSYPFAILVLLMTFYNRLDSVMLERILPGDIGKEQSGIYAHAYRLLDATNMIAYLFSVLLLPIFSKMLKHREPISHMLRLSITILITLAIIVTTGSYFYRVPLMSLLYKEHIQESSVVFGLLMGGFIPISATYIFGTLLTANGNLKALNLIAASGMIINFVLNIVLIPRFLAVGSAWASLSAQSITAAIQIFIVFRRFKLRADYKFALKYILFVIGVILLNLFSRSLTFNWVYSFAFMVFAAFLLAALLRLLSVKSLLDILRNR